MNPNQKNAKLNILRESFHSLMANGIRSFTVDNLAYKMGMSKKTIYKFFPSKEILIEKSVQYFTGIIENKFSTIIENEPDPAIQFVKVMEYIMDEFSRIPIQRMYELKSRYPHIWEKVEEFRLAQRDNFFTMLSNAQKQDQIWEAVNVSIISTLYVNIINSTFQPEFFLKNNLTPKEAIYSFLSMVINGIFIPDAQIRINNYLADH